jgi:redox-sensitive bicupin YhaK (pirin superfamily)
MPSQSPVQSQLQLGRPPWPTLDPFLFCVHHVDHYPAGDLSMGPPPETLRGRRIGMDFEGRDGWNMYHGEAVPGFPRHPHRGFETITIARSGFIDHADSMGATARFGEGDVQWMTAGGGVVHSEMFPLVNSVGPNPAELFQIWINLPAADKMRPAYFTMLWRERIPVLRTRDASGHGVEVRLIAGALPGLKALAPPPSSWAARPESGVRVLTIRLDPGARWVLPGSAPGVNRMLYVVDGDRVRVSNPADDAAGVALQRGSGARLHAEASAQLQGGAAGADLLLLEGRPIGEPVVQHGPFVMNTHDEIRAAFRDYQATGFGGWPWHQDGPVHARTSGRFAIHADGRREEAG